MRSYERPAEVSTLYSVNNEPDEKALAADPANQETDRSLPPVTLWLLISIIAVFLAMLVVGHGNVISVARQFGDKDSVLIQSGQWWRLFTAVFLHGSWLHLIMNGVTLAWFGGQMERLYGGRKFFLIYMVAGVMGNLLSYLMLPGPSLGASGALFGLIGAGLIFPLRFRRLLPVKERETILKQLALVAGINLALSFSPGIDRYAHFGGFIGGGLMALLLIPEVLDERPPSRLREAGLSVAAALILALSLCAAAEQWNVARLTPLDTPITYASRDGDVWWHLDLSARWKLVPQHSTEVSWMGPGNARICVVDSITNPDLYEQTERWRAETGPSTLETRIYGQPATISTLHAHGRVTMVCQLTAYGRTLNVVLECSDTNYEVASQDYRALLSTIWLTPPRLR
jgi:rhomboid protease GluP